MYQFRFGVEETEIGEIFNNNQEISETFEKVFISNRSTLLDRIKDYSKFIQSKSNSCSELKNIRIILSEDEIIQIFKTSLKRYILYSAIQMVFESKLNVTENILELLNNNYIHTCIMNSKLLYAFHYAICDSQDYLVSSDYFTLEKLESEFLQQ